MKKGLLQIILLFFIAVFNLMSCTTSESLTDGSNDFTNEINGLENHPYGYSKQTYNMVSAVIMRNQLLSSILHNNGISAKNIEEISRQSDVFDVKKMRSGNNYHMFFNKKNHYDLEYLIYEHSQTEYLQIGFKDSIQLSFHKKPTVTIKKMAMGTIESNLWDAMLANNIDPMMSIEISEIYAWSIDFFDLKKGDKFYVIYEDEILDDTLSVGTKKIHAALFNHQNKDFYAIHFPTNDEDGFYTEEGINLRNQFLKTPLKYSRISSKYTKRRFHPVLKIYRPHSGVDYAAAIGTPVYSVGEGVLTKKGYHKNGAGNYIRVKHDEVYTTQYAHLLKFASGLKDGDMIKQGQLIGYVGSTGYSTGPHLDFRFYKNGKAIDPLSVHGQNADPIQKINQLEFERLRDIYIYQLRGSKPQFLVAWKDNQVEHEEA